jgi:hypothetical protein
MKCSPTTPSAGSNQDSGLRLLVGSGDVLDSNHLCPPLYACDFLGIAFGKNHSEPKIETIRRMRGEHIMAILSSIKMGRKVVLVPSRRVECGSFVELHRQKDDYFNDMRGGKGLTADRAQEDIILQTSYSP